MTRANATRRRRLPAVRQALLAALIGVAAGCATGENPSRRPGAATDDGVSTALRLWRSQAESSLAEGPGYTLTQLDGMIAAANLGGEGEDAAAVWDEEVKRHFRSRRSFIFDGLRTELASYPAERIARIVAAFAPPEGTGAAADSAAERTALSFLNSRTYRGAHIAAICDSLDSTATAWRVRYPDRAPFTFERFRIDEPRLRSWCPAATAPAADETH